MTLRMICFASAAALLAASQAPALAASSVTAKAATTQNQDLSAARKHRRARVRVYREQGWHNGWGWNGYAADPSLVPAPYNYGINQARATGRCVEDLGYGRYRYCGW